jgi:3-methyladenine DNA glycosylase/8-oxoguanine DNA glycosylase
MTALDALQRTLAGEHAAIFVLAALGGRASTTTPTASDHALREALDRAYDAHVDRRDQLRTMVTAAGGDPVAAEPAYRLPAAVTAAAAGPISIAAAALRIQRACATTYAALVAATEGEERRWAVEALLTIAVGEAAFGGEPEALPGLGNR